MNNATDVRDIDSHPEGARGEHDVNVASLEV